MTKQSKKRIVREVLKYTCPFIFSLGISVLIFLLFGILLKGAGIGGAAIGIGFFAVTFFIGLPLYSAIYSKKLLPDLKNKYLFALYNSLVVTLFYLIPHCTKGQTYMYSAIIFVWISIWGIIPLLPFKKNKTNSAAGGSISSEDAANSGEDKE